jgi:thiamine phosphate synthase YjbQ (UPF0047 family)
MAVYKGQIQVETKDGGSTYVDITSEVADIVRASDVSEGIVTVISAHTTCAVFSEEYDHDHTPTGETFLQADLDNGLGKIFPEQHNWNIYHYPGTEHFKAVESWPDAASYLPDGDRRALWNGDAHLRSTLVGGNQTFEVSKGELQMNGLASIFFVDYDHTRERSRRIRVVVVGQ